MKWESSPERWISRGLLHTFLWGRHEEDVIYVNNIEKIFLEGTEAFVLVIKGIDKS